MARRKRKTRKTRMKYRAPKRRRSTARAAAPKRRRAARRNPKGPLGSPAIKFAAAAGVGAGVSLAVEASGIWGARGGSKAMRAAMTALLMYAASHFLLKGKRRQMGFAVAVGAMIPPAANGMAKALQPALGGAVQGEAQQLRALRNRAARAIAPAPAQRSARNHAQTVRANLIH